jgi:hypothetical protein
MPAVAKTLARAIVSRETVNSPRRRSRLVLKSSFVILGVACAAWLVLGRGGARAAQQKGEVSKEQITPANAKYYGVAVCKECHTTPGERSQDLVLLSEYQTWRTEDRHSLAYAVLEGPRGRQIGRLLGINPAKDAMCLSCHTTSFRPGLEGDKVTKFTLKDGVSCDGCHGPAGLWLTPHFADKETWRAMTPQAKERLGLFDVRNPAKRAALCASCHVGNAAEGKVITHAMYAAGHPPLPSFEVASFSQNLPPHWRDLIDVPYFKTAPKEVRKAYHLDSAAFQHTQLALAGGAATGASVCRLLAARAHLEASDRADKAADNVWPPPWIAPLPAKDESRRWPELATGAKFDLPTELRQRWPEVAMALSDCYACHHDLKSDSWRQQRGYPAAPGRPQLPAWPTALVQPEKSFRANWTALQRAFASRPFGKPAEIAKAAMTLEASYFGLLGSGGRISMDEAKAKKVLRELCTLPADSYPDYDTARQLAWAVRALYYDHWNAKNKDGKIEEILRALDDELSLTRQSEARQKFVKARLTLVKEKLAKKTEKEAAKVQSDLEGFLRPLQAINDAEEAAVLERLGRYDPRTFRQRLEEMAKRLAAKSPKQHE